MELHESDIRVPAQWPAKLPVKIAFVGEAPSHKELRELVPLVGSSGKLFNSLLRTAKIERSDCLVTNVFDEKIPENKIKHWCVGLKEARTLGITDLPPVGTAGFLLPEFRPALERLRREIEAAAPTVIVPLGGTALWAFTGQANIGQMRGTALPATRLVPGAKLVPTYHPSFVMKKFSLYSVVSRDLLFAVQESEHKEVQHAARYLLLEPTLAELEGTVPKLLASRLLSVDIETSHGQITCVGFAWDTEHAVSVPFYDARQTDHNYWRTAEEEVKAWRIVEHVLASDVPKVGQFFGGYDFFWLLRKNRLAVRNFRHDTRLMSHALYPELPKDLGFLGSSYASQGAWKYMGRGEKRDDNQSN